MNITRSAHPARLHAIAMAAVLATAGLLASASQVTPARATTIHAGGGPKPTIVLEHGAWANASGWSEEIKRLQADAYTVYAPPNPLRGLANDSARPPKHLRPGQQSR